MKNLFFIFLTVVLLSFSNKVFAQDFFLMEGEPLKKVIGLEKYYVSGTTKTFNDSADNMRLRIEFLTVEKSQVIKIYHPYYFRGKKCCPCSGSKPVYVFKQDGSGKWYTTHRFTNNALAESNEEKWTLEKVLETLTDGKYTADSQ